MTYHATSIWKPIAPQCADSHLQMPHPFQNQQELPNNRGLATTRPEHLKRKMERDETIEADVPVDQGEMIDIGRTAIAEVEESPCTRGRQKGTEDHTPTQRITQNIQNTPQTRTLKDRKGNPVRDEVTPSRRKVKMPKPKSETRKAQGNQIG